MHKTNWNTFLLDRMYSLNCSLYKIIKDYNIKYSIDKPVSKLHSSISKAIGNPLSSRLETLLRIVEMMGGKFVILWGETSEYLSTEAMTLDELLFRNEELLKELSQVNKQIKEKQSKFVYQIKSLRFALFYLAISLESLYYHSIILEEEE